MKIYTKGGDEGKTSLYGGVRVPKDDLRIRTYGTLDELNATLGLILGALSAGKMPGGLPKEHQSALGSLLRIQGELFQLGAELATPRGKETRSKLLEKPEVQALEAEIDQMEEKLSPLKTFILPGGGMAGAWAHLARTVCRRAERELIVLHRAEPVRPLVLEYMNRLSDYFFVVARYLNHLDKAPESPWIAP